MTKESQAVQAEESSRRRRWWAIGLFSGLPWAMGMTLHAVCPAPPKSEVVIKAELLAQRGPVDTVIAGDSRVGRVEGASFVKRNWAYFNMGMTGLSPEDTAMQVRYVMNRGTVKRVLMGASFENMTEHRPFEHSHYTEAPFRDLDMSELIGMQAPRSGWLEALGTLLPLGAANLAIRRSWQQRKDVKGSPLMRADGNFTYQHVEDAIRDGKRAYTVEPPGELKRYYIYRGEGQYLETQRLDEGTQAIYTRMFRYFRQHRVPCVVFETARTTAYRNAIHDDPVISRLYDEWREYYRSESYGCVRFIDSDQLRDCHDEDDFFDPVHFVGETQVRLTERLAENLADLESSCRQNQSERRAARWEDETR